MSKSAYHRLYFHVVWGTKLREPLIRESQVETIRRMVAEDAVRRGAKVLACGAMPDHIHLLVSLPPTIAVATFVGQVKGAVAHDFNKLAGLPGVAWQEGYGVVTLREADADRVGRYVNNQPAIHAARRKPSVLELTSDPSDPPTDPFDRPSITGLDDQDP